MNDSLASEHQIALRQHERLLAGSAADLRAAIDFGLEAIRTAALINGGSVLACFAFLGAVTELKGNGPLILHAAAWFAAGTILSGLASGAAYFSQINYAVSHPKQLTWHRPFSETTEEEKRSREWAVWWRTITVCLLLGGYSCSIIGAAKIFVNVTI